MKKNLLLLLVNFLCATTFAQTYIPASSPNPSILAYTFQGGSFQSYGCTGLDPAYWLSGSGNSLTVNFVNPKPYPTIRVWGMNDDDTAQITVNGVAYPLNSTSASYDTKVICNTVYGSPGANGVLFTGGLLVGANTNVQGNYSYQNVTIINAAVTSLKITGLSGAGWGIGGITVDKPLATGENISSSGISLSPNPTSRNFSIELDRDYRDVKVEIYNTVGQIVSSQIFDNAKKIVTGINGAAGMYFVKVSTDKKEFKTMKIIKK